MPINILMPALSPTMEKGNLAKWLKREGEKVSPGDVIAEIETDKATMEVEAVDEGVLAKIVVPAGSTDVPVNQLIAVLAAEGEDIKAATAAAAKGAPATSAAAPAAPPRSMAPGEVTPPLARTEIAPKTDLRAAGDRVETSGTARIFSSPLARRLARDVGIDISRISGTGPHGRIIARDVESVGSGTAALRPPAAAAAATATATMSPPLAQALSDDKVRALFEPGSYEVVPHDNVRKIIAQRLVQAKQTVPHFYLTVTCTIDRLLAAREDVNATAPKDGGGKPRWKLSVNDFVIKAMALALMKVPDANVTWTDGGMLKHRHADIGVAVALPGGLITPVIRKAETKALITISNEMKDFASRARARKLKPEEYQGGTTAISNLGMYGIEEFSAVINPPHATILAVGAGQERAVVRDGKVVIATQMKVTLSTDHRAVDGALGAELLRAFKGFVENPVTMVV